MISTNDDDFYINGSDEINPHIGLNNIAISEDYSEFFSTEDLCTTIKVLSAIKERSYLKALAQVDQNIKMVFSLASSIILRPDKSFLKKQKKDRNKDRKTDDNNLLQKTGIKELREYRRNIQGNGSSMPVLIPEKGENMMLTYNNNNPEDIFPSLGSLNFAKTCHICHNQFSEVHFFYDQLCKDCATFNFLKRNGSCDLTGKYAIVTGSRIKIGYCVALKLLRCGAVVIATTRFPRDAARRYASEKDFNEWKHRLRIYGLDFRDISSF
jgi:3-oxoacyl-ACP reductase-like protein